jgi:hypothetical protein
MACVPVELPLRGIELERRLLHAGWEVPVIDGPRGISMVRISTHLYNSLDQIEGLAVALAALGVTGAHP